MVHDIFIFSHYDGFHQLMLSDQFKLKGKVLSGISSISLIYYTIFF